MGGFIPITPDANPLALSIYETERMIALCPTWQGLINTTDWTVARDRIAFVEDDADPDKYPRRLWYLTAI